ncbi:MAG: Tat pathway signal protein, partial [Eggerthellaceae bacterium]|nr:Tat pathway signal protein [Eggerthellaceae bacterium]
HAVGEAAGYEIYDVRANSNGIIWTESNILNENWRVYCAVYNSLQETISNPKLLDEGNADWEVPFIAAIGDYAYWQLRPKVSGNASFDNSLLKRAIFRDVGLTPNVQIVLQSAGRFATAPYPLADALVVTPRAALDTVNYQLTYLDGRSASVMDTMVLPNSMRPFEAGYGKTGFMFSFDAIYNYGRGLAGLGTYIPEDAVRSGNYSEAPWFRFGRVPSAAPCWCGNTLVVKSVTNIACISLTKRNYCVLDIPSGTDDYGEYVASTGMGSSLVTFAQVDYTALNGAVQKYCQVRVWQEKNE